MQVNLVANPGSTHRKEQYSLAAKDIDFSYSLKKNGTTDNSIEVIHTIATPKYENLNEILSNLTTEKYLSIAIKAKVHREAHSEKNVTIYDAIHPVFPNTQPIQSQLGLIHTIRNQIAQANNHIACKKDIVC